MLEQVVNELVAAGHQATVLCSEGGYAEGAGRARSEEIPGVQVIRIRATSFGRITTAGKLADYATFYAGVAWKLLRLKHAPDRIVAMTTPPYLSLLARFCSRLRGADHAHWVMDLYPDVMTAHGMIKEGGIAHRRLRFLARVGFGGKRNRVVVTLGPDMHERIATLLPEGARSVWVPLWRTASLNGGPARGEDGLSLRRDRGWREDEVVMLYSGNMGLGHRFTEFLEAAESAGRLGLKRKFAFFGQGKRRGEIAAVAKISATVELRDHVPRELLAAHLASADVHLASLEPSWDGTMVPSKLQGSFAAGRPVLFVGSGESSIGRWITESGGGWVVEPKNREAMEAALVSACDAGERSRRAKAALEHAARHFDPERNGRSLAEIFVG